MKINKRIISKGRYIEVSIIKTPKGDFIGMAKFQDSQAIGVCRDSNKDTAQNLSIERLLSNSNFTD